MPTLRILEADDAALLEAFLLPRIASSMILLGNLRTAGMVDRGDRFHGTYAGAFDGDELVGVVAHYWNGNAIVQAPAAHVAELCALAVRASGRALSGLLGPGEQLAAALAGLAIGAEQLRLDSVESLFQLQVDALRIPSQLADGSLCARATLPSDLDLLTAWRAAYCIEALQELDSAELYTSSREAEQRGIADGHIWLVEHDGVPVATSGFNAVTAEAVQIGGVYTPPALRNRGYARAAVAQSLIDVRARGVRSSLLFTGDDNPAAQRAYKALGYQRIGDYRIVMLAQALAPARFAR